MAQILRNSVFQHDLNEVRRQGAEAFTFDTITEHDVAVMELEELDGSFLPQKITHPKSPLKPPTMPSAMVPINLPGSFPGMIAFATSPAIRPNTIHSRAIITAAFPGSADSAKPVSVIEVV